MSWQTYSAMAAVNNPVKNMAMQMTLQEVTWFPLTVCPMVGLMDHTIVAVLLLFFEKTPC